VRELEKPNLGGNPDALVVSMQQAKLLDLAHARRLMREYPNTGCGRLARALACGNRTADAILKGIHWQQDPVKVGIFNRLNDCRIPVETGEPDEADLLRFGLNEEERLEAIAKLRRQQRNKAGRRMAVEATKDKKGVAMIEARQAILKRSKPPMKLDTGYFQAQVDETIWRILRELDDVKVAQMNGRELAAAASTLLEKRALLRGEPTQIVRNENRGSLEAVGALLLAEMARRGRKLPTLIDAAREPA
jgi:hypothetical protein